MTLGQRIKELRTDARLTQAQLAKLIEVSQKAVDYWERSVNEPKASYVIKLVRVFNISFNEFFEDVD